MQEDEVCVVRTIEDTLKTCTASLGGLTNSHTTIVIFYHQNT